MSYQVSTANNSEPQDERAEVAATPTARSASAKAIRHEAQAVEELMNQHRFIFLGGLHRSGTSLAFRCLREHPKISGFQDSGAPEDEGQHLQSVYPKAFQHGGPAKFGFSNAMQLNETSPLCTQENRRQLFEEWSRYWDVRAPYLLEKSPPNLIKGRFLQAMFRDTYFIFILRHPAAVTLATRKWKPRMRLSRFLEHWLICHERMRADIEQLERVLVIHYEDFVASPDATLAKMFDFIGLEPPSTGTDEEVRTNVNEKYFAKWRQGTQSMMGRARTKRLINRYEERCRSFGYSLSILADPNSSGRVSD